MSSDDSDSESECYYDSDNGDQDEIICTNMNPQLAKLLGITVVDIEQSNQQWTPPASSGLSNSSRIINDRPNEIFEGIKTCIRTKRSLNEEQLEYVKNIDKDKLCEIIFIYNSAVLNHHK